MNKERNNKLNILHLAKILSGVFLMLLLLESFVFAQDFNYTGDMQTFTTTKAGIYKLEVWGARGGSSCGHERARGGNGGYGWRNNIP